ncbi:hypothetical protein C8A00DRAFT_18635 [Chaetomidium leptoderma]|uniref:Uncharacterized protein n=1 Tax=Chaetomidium leptoderma TaxID=669021 RepID=A0AAN6ZS14_9PEZI|nr:hypothetical protein C8A00DRAFT_18635 [Chaetomidium leptoderma]
MCHFKRVIWACSCPRGVVLVRRCEHHGTPACRRRHLLDRIHVPVNCKNHRLLTEQSSPGPASRRRRHGGSRTRRSGGGLTIRRRSNSGSSSSGARSSSGGSVGSSPQSG